MAKPFKLKASEIRELAPGLGACIATDSITVEGYPVRFMYREAPADPHDSGWHFMSGLESDDYMDDADNHAIYDVNTIANYDPTIVPLLSAPVGSVFEKPDPDGPFEIVEDWAPPE